jgi:small subunit ribosomal protein S4
LALYNGSVCKLCRRERTKLYLKGARCTSKKCSFTIRAYAPGQHGQSKTKSSNFAVRLREKQKVKRVYHILENQFEFYFEKALRKKGMTGQNLLVMLERRLDNTVYRLGLASSRKQARQLVRHGHIFVNNKKVDIPSSLVKLNDAIKIKAKTANLKIIKDAVEGGFRGILPGWLSVDAEKREGKVLRLPVREDITFDFPINEQYIVEFYSK